MLLSLSDVTYVLIGWFKFSLVKFLYEYGPLAHIHKAPSNVKKTKKSEISLSSLCIVFFLIIWKTIYVALYWIGSGTYHN